MSVDKRAVREALAELLAEEDAGQIVDREVLRKLSPEETVKARKAGRLDLLMAGVDLSRGKALSADQWRQVVANMSDEELAAADAAGRLDPLHKAAGQLPSASSADQGARGPHETSMKERLKTMSAEQTSELLHSGKLDGLLRGDE